MCSLYILSLWNVLEQFNFLGKNMYSTQGCLQQPILQYVLCIKSVEAVLQIEKPSYLPVVEPRTIHLSGDA